MMIRIANDEIRKAFTDATYDDYVASKEDKRFGTLVEMVLRWTMMEGEILIRTVADGGEWFDFAFSDKNGRVFLTGAVMRKGADDPWSAHS